MNQATNLPQQCAQYDGDCDAYTQLTNAGKPVFHIEYVKHHSVSNGVPIVSDDGSSSESNQLKEKYCLKSKSQFSGTFSTTIKVLALDGWVLYCDDSYATTVTVADGVKKGQHDCPNGN
jgi:hypothetical protein